MIELTNITTQTIPAGGAVTFNVASPVLKSGCAEGVNNMIPTAVKLKAQGIYDINFSGNVTNTVAGQPVQLAIAAGNVPLAHTARTVTPTVAGDLWDLYTGTFYRNCGCDFDMISIINTGANPVVIAPNSSLRISRRS